MKVSHTQTEKPQARVSFRRTESPADEKTQNKNPESGARLRGEQGGSRPQTSVKEGAGKHAESTGFFQKAAAAQNKSDSRTASLPVNSQNPFPQKAADAPGGAGVSAREIFRQIAADLGFPKDSLSLAILASGRFFSLSPNRTLLGNLRRELLASKSSAPGASKEKAAFEAEALAAAAAFDKGLTLTPGAVERYAAFFDFPAGAEDKEESDDAVPDNGELPGAEEVRAAAEEEVKKNDILDILNALPGKNGQYWSVFPFKITVKGIELSVILRILKRAPVFGEEAVCLVGDVTGGKRRWRFFLEENSAPRRKSPQGDIRASGNGRLDIQVFPALSPRALGSLKKEAERFFGGAGGNPRAFREISVRNGEAGSWAESIRDPRLPSVNEEV